MPGRRITRLGATLDFHHGLLGRGRGESPQGADDLLGLREAVFRALGEDELVVGDDVELTAGARDDVGVDAERLRDRGRQTGGLWQVVSNFAVADRHLHD